MFIYILKNLLTRKKRKDNRIGEVTNQVVKRGGNFEASWTNIIFR